MTIEHMDSCSRKCKLTQGHHYSHQVEKNLKSGNTKVCEETRFLSTF